MKYSVPAIVGSSLFLVFATGIADVGFRCGSHLIDVGDKREEVLEHCGEPTSERGWTWVYDRGSSEFSILIHFEADGTVGRISNESSDEFEDD